VASVLQGIKEWFFGIGDNPSSHANRSYFETLQTKVAFKEYAIQICINKIANALSMCDYITYDPKGKKTDKAIKGNLWYQLNVSPNPNQSSADFWQKAIRQAVYDVNGALIIQMDGGKGFVVADSYDVKEFAFVPNIYSNIKIGDLLMNKTYNETQVLRLKLNNSKVKEIVDGVYEEYGKLIGGAIKNYNRNNSKKLWIKMGTMFNQLNQVVTEKEDGTVTTEADLILDDLFTNRLKGYFDERDSATPLEEGLEVQESQENKQQGKEVTTRDVKDLLDDVVNFVADAFGIPRGLLKGDVADVEAMTDNFIAFCINPIANVIEDECNRKLYTQDEIISGKKLAVKTTRIKAHNPVDVASSAEALYRIGVANVNYIRWLINEEPIDEDWAEDYALTKNYERNHDKGEVT